MKLLDEFRMGCRCADLLKPGVTTVTDNLQQPCARLGTAEAGKEAVRANECFLRHVFGIGAITQQPPCKVQCRIKMRKHQLLKSFLFFWLKHLLCSSS